MSSPTVRSHDAKLANFSGSVVSRFIHQAGCMLMSAMDFSVRAGGIAKPLRLSLSRAPETGASTATSSASKPAALARAARSAPAARSR